MDFKTSFLEIKTPKDWYVAFEKSCQQGSLEEVKFLITNERFSDIGFAHAHEEQGLRWACMNGHLEVVKYLLTSQDMATSGHGFVDHQKESHQTILIDAVESGQLEVVRYLTSSIELQQAGHEWIDPVITRDWSYEEEAIQSYEPLIRAVEYRRMDILDFFLKSGWQESGHAPIEWRFNNDALLNAAFATQDINAVNYFLKDPYFMEAWPKETFIETIQKNMNEFNMNMAYFDADLKNDIASFFIELWDNPYYESLGLDHEYLKESLGNWCGKACFENQKKVFDWLLESPKSKKAWEPMNEAQKLDILKVMLDGVFYNHNVQWMETLVQHPVFQNQGKTFIGWDMLTEYAMDHLTRWRRYFKGVNEESKEKIKACLRWLVFDCKEQKKLKESLILASENFQPLQECLQEYAACQEHQELMDELRLSNKEHQGMESKTIRKVKRI